MKALMIVGATGKIAEAVVSRCLDENAFDKYLLTGRKIDRLEEFRNRAQGKITLAEQDMQNPNTVSVSEEWFADVDEVRVLMLAFSIHPIDRIGRLRENDIAENIGVNIQSQVLYVNALCRLREKSGFDLRFIWIDSGAAYTPLQGWSLYCSAKAYMSMFFRCLCTDTDVRAVLFEPGVIDTPMQAYIRRIDETVFDRALQFRQYKEDGILKQPEVVAGEICERYLLTWSAAELKERCQK